MTATERPAPDDWVRLYSGDEASAESLARYLDARSIEVRRNVANRRARPAKLGRIARVDVRVPPDDIEAARALYEEWRGPRRARGRARSRRLLGIVATSLLVPVLWLVADRAGVPDVPRSEPPWLLAVWMLALVVCARLADRR